MKLSYILSVSTAVLLFTGCGGGSSSSEVNEGVVTGQFIDSAVQGLGYSCSSGTKSITDEFGKFTCKAGDTVTFDINGFIIGSTTAQSFITPQTLFSNDANAVTNLAQLLQTLDSDNNPNNGIVLDPLSQEVQSLSGTTNIDFSQVDFDSAMVTYIGVPLVDATTAEAHLNISMQNLANSASGLTSLSTVIVMNGLDAEFCANLQDSQTQTFEGFADYSDFIEQGGSQSISYFSSAQNCDTYSSAGFCEVQDFSNTLGGSGSCVQAITFPFVPGTGTDENTTVTPPSNVNEIDFSEYTSTYKPMMPNLRSDNVWFSGTAYTATNSIDTVYQEMSAEDKIADFLWFVGGNPLYGYEKYTDIYAGDTLITYYYDSQTDYTNTEGTWNISVVNNIYTKDSETKSTKFSKPITADTLRQMYLEVGLDITFDSNDKGQFMLTSDSSSYSFISLALNESAHLKVLAEITNQNIVTKN